MSYTHPHNQFVTRFLLPDNLDGINILDCACGFGTWGFFIKSQKDGVPYIEGFDIYAPYIERLRKLNLYDYVSVMDIRDIEKLGRRYDIILAMDVLEHLEKNDALTVMKKLEMLCDMTLIISLPIGRQSHGDGDENIHQLHKSIFHQDEMEKYGYKIRSMSKFTRILSFVEKIRCFLFRLEYKEGRFVAWKEFNARA